MRAPPVSARELAARSTPRSSQKAALACFELLRNEQGQVLMTSAGHYRISNMVPCANAVSLVSTIANQGILQWSGE
jgi:hypothetical protein